MPVSAAFGTAIGLAVETTPGTPVSRSVWLEVVSVDGGEELERTPTDAIGSLSAAATGYALTSKSYNLTIEMHASYREMGVLLYAALGAKVTTGASAPYSHTFTHALNLPALTVEVVRGGSGRSTVYAGCYVDKMSVKATDRGYSVVTVELVAMGATVGAAGTPSLSTDGQAATYIPHTHLASITWGAFTWGPGGDDIVQGVTVDLVNNLAPILSVGNAAPAGFYRSGRWEVSATIDLYQISDDLHDACLTEDGIPGDCVVRFESGSSVFEATLHYAIPKTWKAGTIAAGELLTETVELAGQPYGSDLGAAVVVTNASSTYYG